MAVTRKSLTPFTPELLSQARSRFPALATPWALFDNAGGSVPLGGVIDRVTGYMRRYGVQLGASYELSQQAGALVARVHAAGALACLDGVAFAPHRLVDVKTIGADFYSISLYKLYGPHIGMLYGRHELLECARGQYHFFHAESELPYKLEPGGVVHELAASVPGILEYLLELEAGLPAAAAVMPAGAVRSRLARAFDAIARHESALVAPLLEFLGDRRGVRVLGESSADPARRVPTVAFTVEGRKASEFPPMLDARHVAVRYGHFYAYHAIAALGLLERDGVVRVSMAHYNTPAEVTRLIEALDEVLPS